MDRREKAVQDFKQGCSCSQAIFSAYADAADLDRETALRVASGFGGGMARLGRTCGAVSGGIMVLGLKHGAGIAGNEEAKLRLYETVRRFVAEFEARHGSSDCRTLLGVDIGTPEGMSRAREQKLFETRCADFVRDAAEILERIV
jgi:C_GCAxxG_C_C family probable redox protein